MSNALSNNWKWSSLLSAAAVFLFVSAFWPVPEPPEIDMPLCRGLMDPDVLSDEPLLSFLLQLAMTAGIIISAYFIQSRAFDNSSHLGFVLSFILLFIYSDPESVYFAPVYPAAICLNGMQCCFLRQQRFGGFLLLSAASFFYAPLFWLVPVAFLLSFSWPADRLRNILKAAGGILFPWIYILSLRWILYGDPDVFIQQYFSGILQWYWQIQSIRISSLFLLLCVVLIAGSAVLLLREQLYRGSKIVGKVLLLENTAAVLLFVIYLLFARGNTSILWILTATPLALIFSHYFTQTLATRWARVQLILFLCAVILSRTADLIS